MYSVLYKSGFTKRSINGSLPVSTVWERAHGGCALAVAWWLGCTQHCSLWNAPKDRDIYSVTLLVPYTNLNSAKS